MTPLFTRRSFIMIKPAFFACAALLCLQACSEQPADSGTQTTAVSEQPAQQTVQTPPATQPQAPPISPTPARPLAEISTELLDSMGGRAQLEAVSTLTMKGSGTRRHLGQVPATGGVDP